MSYDWYLYRKDNIKKPFDNEMELRDKLKDKYKNISFHNENGVVMGFDIGVDALKGDLEFYHQGEKNGYYWTYCSYGVDKNIFNIVRENVENIALALDLQIVDQQTVADEQARSLLPAISKYFILYKIICTDPNSSDFSKLLLILEDDKLECAGKVEPGQTLKETIDKDIIEFTESQKYLIIRIDDNYDSAPDKNNNIIPRTSVVLKVDYFDPKTIKTKYPMKWIRV